MVAQHYHVIFCSNNWNQCWIWLYHYRFHFKYYFQCILNLHFVHNFTSVLESKLILKAKINHKSNCVLKFNIKRIIHLKKKKKILKTIEVTKQKKKLTSPSGPALSSHAERTGTGLCFRRMANECWSWIALIMASKSEWEEDNQLEQDLKTYVSQNLKRSEVLDFMQRDFPQYNWSLTTLDRRLRHFGIHYIYKIFVMVSFRFDWKRYCKNRQLRLSSRRKFLVQL